MDKRMTAFSVGGCRGCTECSGSEYDEFSHETCELCGTRQGGVRHYCHYIWKEKPTPYEQRGASPYTEATHAVVCEDCGIEWLAV